MRTSCLWQHGGNKVGATERNYAQEQARDNLKSATISGRSRNRLQEVATVRNQKIFGIRPDAASPGHGSDKSDSDHSVLLPSYFAFFAIQRIRSRGQIEPGSNWGHDFG